MLCLRSLYVRTDRLALLLNSLDVRTHWLVLCLNSPDVRTHWLVLCFNSLDVRTDRLDPGSKSTDVKTNWLHGSEFDVAWCQERIDLGRFRSCLSGLNKDRFEVRDVKSDWPDWPHRAWSRPNGLNKATFKVAYVGTDLLELCLMLSDVRMDWLEPCLMLSDVRTD